MTTPGSTRGSRLVLGGILPLLIVTAAIVPFLVFSSRLPEPIATTWGTDGRANASAPRALFVAVTALLTGVPAGVLAWAARRREPRRQEVALPAAIATCFGAIVAAVSVSIVRANLDQPSWTTAPHVGLGVNLPLPLLVAPFAALAWVVARRLEDDSAPDAPGSPPSVGLQAGERALWMGTVRCRWAVWLAAAGIFAGVVLMATVNAFSGPALLVAGIVGLAFTSLEVRIDRLGVHIAFGALGWPRMSVDLARIAQATTVAVVPMQWGGWGYRGSLRILGRAAIVLRGGEALRLDLVDGKRLLVTIDGAEQAAGVVNDLIGARARPASLG